MSVKNEEKAKAKFLHEMYVTLRTETQYIQVEGKKAMTEFGLGSEKQKALFGKFLTGSTNDSKEAFIEEWKQVRPSQSSRRFFLMKRIKTLEAADA